MAIDSLLSSLQNLVVRQHIYSAVNYYFFKFSSPVWLIMYGQYKEKIDLAHSGSEKYSEENGVLIILREQFSTAEYHIGVSV